MGDFADYYREIYARGLGGETPSIPVAIEEQELRAHEAMDPRAANYVFAEGRWNLRRSSSSCWIRSSGRAGEF